MIANSSSQLVPGGLELRFSVLVGGSDLADVGAAVAVGVEVGVGVGTDSARRTVALSSFEVTSSADDAVATFVTLPAVTSGPVIM